MKDGTMKKESVMKYGAGTAVVFTGLKALGGAGVLKMAITLVVSLGFYAMTYGWSYAAIIIGLLLIHEMGHWIFMKIKGLNPQAPIFVPFFGAFVAMKNLPPDEATDAWVAFWGPLIGGLGAVAIYATGVFTNNGMLMAAGNFGFFLNLLQLVPVKPLDGGFIANVISKWLMIPGIMVILALGIISQSILLLAIGVIPIFTFFANRKKAQTEVTPEDAEQPQIEMKKASKSQRFAIGISYVGLACFLGIMQIVAAYQMQSNKEYAKVQLSMLDTTIKHSTDVTDYRDRSQYLEVLGRLKESESDLEHYLKSGQGELDDYITLAALRFSQGRMDKTAHKALDVALDEKGATGDDAWQIAYAYLLGKDYKNALRAAQRCDENGRNDIQAFVYAKTGKLKEARACSQIAMQYPPSYLISYCRKALLDISENELPTAKLDIEEIQKEDSDHPLGLLMRGWYAYYTNDLDGALNSAETAISALEEPGKAIFDKHHIITACHRLKSATYEKLSNSEKNSKEKQEYERLAIAELDAFKSKPEFDIYVPRDLSATQITQYPTKKENSL